MTAVSPEAAVPSPFAHDPFYAMGKADAYDEHRAGDTVHTLQQRAEQMLDAIPAGTPGSLYAAGYATCVLGLMASHIAEVNAQADVAHTSQTRKQHPIR